MLPPRGHFLCIGLVLLLLVSLQEQLLAFSLVTTTSTRSLPNLNKNTIRTTHLVERGAQVNSIDDPIERPANDTSRRDFVKNIVGGFVVSTALAHVCKVPKAAAVTVSSNQSEKSANTKMIENENKNAFEPIDIQKVALENKVNITLTNKKENSKFYLNRTSFEKVRERTFPSWVPKIFLPKPQSYARVSDAELVIASSFAGSLTEIIRFWILYPISTVKTRLQSVSASANNTAPTSTPSSTPEPNLPTLLPTELSVKNEGVSSSSIAPSPLLEMLFMTYNNIRVEVKKGNLYAGFLPAAFVSVPASGAYFAVSDVMKKEIRMSPLNVDEFSVLLLSALIADVVSLAVRTPAVTFSTRRQARQPQSLLKMEMDLDMINHNNTEVAISDVPYYADVISDNGVVEDAKIVEWTSNLTESDPDWWQDLWNDSWRQLPTIIITDLPYLLLRITLVKTLASGDENIAQFELLSIFASCASAAITTPFDVVRTAILVDSDGKSKRESVVEAMKRIAYGHKDSSTSDSIAGDVMKKPRVQDLYAGWFERVAYLGIGVAWLAPLRTLSYYAIRDAVILSVFR
jgi:hypothetical protein